MKDRRREFEEKQMLVVRTGKRMSNEGGKEEGE
jgi:hypothetical protein